MDNLIKLLQSDTWPLAVEQFMICDDNDKSKENRAESIIDILLKKSINGQKFLDYGCGEGHCAKVASQRTSLTVGYDIDKQWADDPILTTDWETVKSQAPYNIILAYDVLDHSIAEKPVDVLRKLSSVLAKDGKMYIRCHPWCSRHGAHLYKKINKAYIHLVFSESELKELGYEADRTIRVIHPIITYESWIKDSGLKISNKSISAETAENFFMSQPLVDRIKRNWSTSLDGSLRVGAKFPKFQMEQQFHDYTLVKM